MAGRGQVGFGWGIAREVGSRTWGRACTRGGPVVEELLGGAAEKAEASRALKVCRWPAARQAGPYGPAHAFWGQIFV